MLALLVTKAYPADKCRPNFTIPSPSKTLVKVSADIKKNPVYVFFDGSLSMKGFVVKQPPQDSIYVDLHDMLKVNPLENKGEMSQVTCCSNPEELKNTLTYLKNGVKYYFINF